MPDLGHKIIPVHLTSYQRQSFLGSWPGMLTLNLKLSATEANKASLSCGRDPIWSKCERSESACERENFDSQHGCLTQGKRTCAVQDL